MQKNLKLKNPVRSAYYATALLIIATAIVLPLAAYGLLTASLTYFLFSAHSKLNAKT